MPDSKKIIDITDGEPAADLQTIETKIDKLMDIKSQEPAVSPATAPKLPVVSPTVEAEPEADLAAENETEDDVARLTADWKSSGITGDAPKDVEFVAVDEPLDGEAREVVDKALAELDEPKAKPQPVPMSLPTKIRRFVKAWWHNRRARWATIIGVVIVVLALAILPASRAFGLNVVGVRGTAQLTVLDATTQLPLQHAMVSLGATSGETDARGQVTLANVKLGSQSLNVHKVAFAGVTKNVSTGFGTTNLGSIALKAVGTQYKFIVTDYLSGKPVITAQAESTTANGQATAIADKQGYITLTVPATGDSTLTVNLTASGYRTATTSVKLGSSDVTPVQLVSALSSVSISKQTGKYDVYKSDLDGKNKQLLLAASGNETSDNTLVEDGSGQEAALVNNRDTTKDSSGYQLQTLTLINVKTGAPTTIDHSERIQLIDWVGDRLVYVAIKAGASAANSSRYLLMSYDSKTNQRLQLDHANAFNDVLSADGFIYYATSNAYNGGVSQFTKLAADGSGKQALLVSEVWNVFRLDYSDFRLATGDSNYSYALGATKPVTTTDSYNNQNRLYIDSPDGKHSLWVDQRDGKGTLLSYDTTTKKDTVLSQVADLNYPVRWLGNSTVVYRLKSNSETADYAVSLNGGQPKKITDVTDAGGLALWYYY